MLPEFLYPVGNSMQDISRDDFSLLNGNTTSEKDLNCPTLLNAGTQPAITPTILTPTAQQPSATTTASLISTSSFGSINNFEPSISRTNSALQPTFRSIISANDQNSIFEASTSLIGDIKLEDQESPDLFPTHASTWQQHPMNSHEHAHHRHQHQQQLHHQQHSQYRFMNDAGGIGCSKLLLQGSDDPLISRGANSVTDDDPPAEFNTLIAAASAKEQQQYQKRVANGQNPLSSSITPTRPTPRPSNGCSSLTKQQLKIKANLMSQTQQQQKGQNQVTQPPQTSTAKRSTPKAKKKPAAVKLRFHHQALPAEYLSHYEATQTQAQAPKKELFPVKLTPSSAKLPPPKSAHENVRSWLQKMAELQRNPQPSESLPTTHDANNNQPEAICAMTETELGAVSSAMEEKAKQSSAHVKRVVKYSDLPYMGEITLDHSKPRRGRKPKKADICHLIYKNYGTILPGTPKNKLDKSEVTIIESGDSKVAQEVEEDTISRVIAPDEPLNLCLRDQSAVDSFSISSNDDDENDDDDEDELEESASNCRTPLPAVATDVATDSLLAANLKLAMKGVLLEERPTPKLEPCTAESPKPSWSNGNEQSAPNPGMHPMSIYYQKLIESGTLITPSGLAALGLPVETIQRDNQLALKIPIPSGLFLTPKQEKTSPAPCSSSNQIEYPEPMSTPSSIKSENSAQTNISSANQSLQPAPKRKRSAIFIPPMPAENANNPSNEVSICKFKFTGGARPSLQEKKMLSVDAGGNYRYYSGTGDKSMRGYEFFPRESLQHSGGALPVSGEKLALDIPPPSAGLSNELLQIPDSPTSNLLLLHSVTTAGQESVTQANSVSLSSLTPSPNPIAVSSTSSSNGHTQKHAVERKKKSRRSAQREKLEKTFKEKGFLIQTQQLESAEGATYCKFRQLKKFTRYLFRNWKDYLPDELQQANEAAAAAAAAAAVLNEQQTSIVEQHQTVAGHNTTTSLESILASHGFASSAQGMRIIRQRHLSNARTPVESGLE